MSGRARGPLVLGLAALACALTGAGAGAGALAAASHHARARSCTRRARAPSHVRGSRERHACHSRKHKHAQTGVPGSGSAGGAATGPAGGAGGAAGAPSAPTGPSGGSPLEGGGGGSAPPTVPHVLVTAVEWSFALSRTSVPAGKVVLQFVDHGQDEHNLNLTSQGELAGSLANTHPEEMRQLTLDLRAGTYTLFCSLPEHEQRGMKSTLLVQ